MGQNIASEIYGKGDNFLRPVLILQRFYGDACLVVPLTSRAHAGSYYSRFADNKGREQTAILSQVRYIDGRRLHRELSKISAADYESLLVQLFTIIKNKPQLPKQPGDSHTKSSELSL